MTADALAAFRREAAEARGRLLAALEDARGIQERLIRRYLAENAQTAFGREHGFASIATVDDYRAAVPIRTYDELAPWIDRAVAGEADVLTAGHPIMFMTTGGTSGKSKYIPVTPEFEAESFFDPKAEWGSTLLLHPELAERDDAVLNLVYDPTPPTTTPSGVPVMRGSQFISLIVGLPGFDAPWTRPPPHVHGPDPVMYWRLRLAVEHDLRGARATHAGSLALLAQRVKEWGPRLIAELHDGTVAGVAATPNRERARELEGAMAREGVLRPRHVWPRCKVLMCWTGSTAAFYLPQLLEAFGEDADVIPTRHSTTEAPVLVPIDRGGQVPIVTSLFLELLPVGESRATGRTLLLDELDDGADYELVLTQAAGLYRYALGDILRVVGRFGRVPRLKFIGRAGAYSSLVAENLYEHQVELAVSDALARRPVRIANYTCCPHHDAEGRARYVFVLELEDGQDLTEAARDELAGELDAALGRANESYQRFRAGPLFAAQVRLVPAGTFGRWRVARIEGGAGEVQYKERHLQTDEGILAELLALG
jgi:hypothetical protein